MITKQEISCYRCNGSGKLRMEYNCGMSSTSFIYTDAKCPKCNGVGRLLLITETNITTKEITIEKD